jgi:hypothetical protein
MKTDNIHKVERIKYYSRLLSEGKIDQIEYEYFLNRLSPLANGQKRLV